MKTTYSRKISRNSSLLMVTLIFCVAQICPAYAIGETNSANENNMNNLNKSIDSGELERFTNDIFNKNMDEYNIPGAVISIVKDGKVILSNGYGYANLEKKTPVVPDKTMFRIASVTKLFTSNALMQMV